MTKEKILIIDDDADFVESTKVVMEDAGFSIFSGKSLEEARKLVEEIKPNLIILDVVMEKMSDGFDFARELKSSEDYRLIPILMVTAIGSMTGFNFSPQAGDNSWLPVDDYAEKPVPAGELVNKVKKLLALKK